MSNKMNTMNCRRADRLLPPYLDGELAGRAQASVAAHLASCPACRVRLEELTADGAFLRSGAGPHPSPYLAARVMAEVRAQGRTPRFAFRRALAATAAVLLIAVSVGAGVFFGSGLSQNGSADNPAVTYLESASQDLYVVASGGE